MDLLQSVLELTKRSGYKKDIFSRQSESQSRIISLNMPRHHSRIKIRSNKDRTLAQ